MTRSAFVLLALLVLVTPAWAQQPVALASWGTTPTTTSETTPLPICLSDKTACFTAFGTVPEFDLAATGVVNVPGYAIAIEGATGPVAVGTATPLPVIVSSSSIFSAVGNVNAGAADTGAPIKVGGIAYTSALPTAVTNAQRVNAFFDKNGRAIVANSPREFIVDGAQTLTATTTETTILAGAANTYHDLIWASCTNESPTEVRIDWRDATADAAPKLRMDLAPDGGGSNMALPKLKQDAVNSNWTIQASASVSSVYCTVIALKDN